VRNRRDRRVDALRVRDRAALERHVEVDAREDALAREVHLVDRELPGAGARGEEGRRERAPPQRGPLPRPHPPRARARGIEAPRPPAAPHLKVILGFAAEKARAAARESSIAAPGGRFFARGVSRAKTNRSQRRPPRRPQQARAYVAACARASRAPPPPPARRLS